MCHAPQFSRYNYELKERIELELNASQRYECDNCGWEHRTYDALSMICPECRHPLSLFNDAPIVPPMSCMV